MIIIKLIKIKEELCIMSNEVGKKTEELLCNIKDTHPDAYDNIEYILKYLELHNSNKDIYEYVKKNGLIKTIKKGVCNLLEEINILQYENDNLQKDNNNLTENNNNIEKEYIKIINKKRKRSENEDKIDDDNNTCKICFELDENTLLNCGHKFCGVCLVKVKNTNNKCPMCRTKITSKKDIV